MFGSFLNEALYGQHPVINEVSFDIGAFDNLSIEETLAWVEIYNPTSVSVNLSDYRLSNKEYVNDLWEFPSVDLQPGDFFVVFLSQGNQSQLPYYFSGFQIRNGMDGLYLFHETGELVDAIDSECIPVNLSFGRWPDALSDFHYLESASPMQTNNESDTVNFVIPETTIHPTIAPGFYADEVTLDFVYDPLYQVFYTLNNGSVPTANSAEYSESIKLSNRNFEQNVFSMINTTRPGGEWEEPNGLVNKSSVVRAGVFYEGCPVSEIFTGNYFIGHESAGLLEDVISLNTDPDNFFDDKTGLYVYGENENFLMRGIFWERPVHVAFFNHQRQEYLSQNAGVRIHGGGTREGPQKSLRLYAREEYSESWFNFPFFEDREDVRYKRLLLRMSMGDWSKTLFKDDLCHYLVRDLNIAYQSSRPAVLYLNGEYWGIQNIRERQDDHYLEARYDVEDGHLVDEIEFSLLNQSIVVENGSIQEYNDLMSFIRLNDLSDNDAYQVLSDMMDIPNLIDHYIAHLYFANSDFPDNNNALWREQGDSGIWRWLFFDCDACMMRPHYNGLVDHIQPGLNLHDKPEWSMELLRALFRNTTFSEQFSSRFRALLQTHFNPGVVIEAIDRFERIYAPLVHEHIRRWNTPQNFSAWQRSVQDLRAFAISRPAVLNDWLDRYFGKPFVVFPNPTSGMVSLKFKAPSTPEKVVLFNVNGSIVYEQSYPEAQMDQLVLPEINGQGVFLLRILLNGVWYSEKLIVIR